MFKVFLVWLHIKLEWWSTRKLGIALFLAAGLIGIIGYLNQYNHLDLGILENLFRDFYTNVTTELITIAITILIVDALYERKETQQEKKTLILRMGSPDNTTAIEAVRQLRARGWLFDGSLNGALLDYANLAGVDLDFADLQHVYLRGANLKAAKVTNANFENASLRKANLQEADIAATNFRDADLTNVDLRKANLSETDLSGAQMEKVNLHEAKIWPNVYLKFLEKDMLSVAYSLRGATMPDGSQYLGKYKLNGDITEAQKLIEINDPVAMEDFYRNVPSSDWTWFGTIYDRKSWADEREKRTKS